ncbi:hypothetical protein DFH06DRAFT_122022 [Mycena polygramma]|nr:hypothetical protein DFH06DRAFT_122022 [Mycena polygramma]
MSSKLSSPLLPPDLIKKILSDDMMAGAVESQVFSQYFHENRLLMRHFITPHSPDSFFTQDDTIGFTAELKRTPLHLSAYDGDVLAVYELLALGATADKPDISGITPICLAISQLAKVMSPGIVAIGPNGAILKAADLAREASRLKFVIRILVEQHVVLNTSMHGEPLMNLLCRSRAWDIITLFLEHGARCPDNPAALFKTTAERTRFASIAKTATNRPARPARKCPCWSGRTVERCHAEAQPYPLGYVCVCGSAKSYKKCCHSRRSYVVEKWDPTLKRIMHDYERSQCPEIQVLQRGDQLRKAVAQATGIEVEVEDRPFAMPHVEPEQWQDFVKELLGDHLGVVDPAFAYTLSRVDFLPRPESRKCSRFLAQSRQERWNAVVDEYINTQKDGRSRHSIERAAKIGPWNGALLRACEGPNCNRVEGANFDILKLCGKCKMSVYCDSSCQTRAWKTHKAKCGQNGQREQSLPSQDVLLQRVRFLTGNLVKGYETLLADASAELSFMEFIKAQQKQ